MPSTRCLPPQARELCAGSTLEAFLADRVLQLAGTHVVQAIGEAASRTSEAFRAEHPSVPWRAVVGMRHQLVHDYSGTDFSPVWDVVQNHLPPLLAALSGMFPPDNEA